MQWCLCLYIIYKNNYNNELQTPKIKIRKFLGPSVLEIINSLLSHLRDSVKNEASQTEEKEYQEALINALGEFANHLPDYQKIEIMMFIMSKIPFPLVNNNSPADNLLQSILLKSLLKVWYNFRNFRCIEMRFNLLF